MKTEISKLVHEADIDLPLNIGFKRSSNLFYRRYPYKVRIPNYQTPWGGGYYGAIMRSKFPQTQEGLDPDIHAIRNMLGRVDLWIKSMSLKRPDDYNIRRESTVNLFFQDKSLVEAFAAEFKNSVIDVWGPQSDHQLDTMLEDEQVVVKNKLWHNKFRWKLTYLGTRQFRERDAKTVFEHISRTNPNDFHLSPNFRRSVGLIPIGGHHIYNWTVCSIYCKEQEDTLFLKMATNETLTKIERCVTFDELKEDK